MLVINGEPYVRSDGFCYYHIAKSIINENNFVSKAEPEYWNYMGHVKETYNNQFISVCAPGAALFHLPGLIIANVIDTGQTIDNNYFIAYNGHSLAEGVIMLITTFIAFFVAIYLVFRTLIELGFSVKISLFSIAAFVFSTYVLWYVLLLPSYTHIFEILCLSGLIYFLVKFQKSRLSNYLIFAGASSGMLILTRPVLATAVLVTFIYLLYLLISSEKSLTIWLATSLKSKFPRLRLKRIKSKGHGESLSVTSDATFLKSSYKELNSKLGYLFKYIVGGLPFALIYLAYNFSSYGKFITSGYSDVRGEAFTFSSFNGLNVLFSENRGLFIYTPVLLLSVLGCYFLWKKSRLITILFLTMLIIVASIYGFWAAWWGGGSYGSRFMLFIFPFGAIGLSALLNWARLNKYFYFQNFKLNIFKLLVGLTIMLTLYSSLIMVLYRVTPIGVSFYKPASFVTLNLDAIKDSGSLQNYLKKLPTSIQDGSGLLALAFGISDYVITLKDSDKDVKFKLFTPPRSTQALPNNVEFYFQDSEKILYKGVINGISKDLNLSITLSEFTNNQNANITSSILNEEVMKLPVSDFEAIYLNELKSKIFLRKGQNIQFRGNLIPWRIEDPFFTIN